MSVVVDCPDLQARAERWIAAELIRLQRVHGERWPDVAEWLESNVREEARQKALQLRGNEA